MHSYHFPAQMKLKANRLDSKPISLGFNQHKTFAYFLGFKIRLCPSALRWFCHHSSVFFGLSQTPVGFAAPQSPISKLGNLFLLCRQLAFPLVGSMVKQQHPGTEAQSSALRSPAVCWCCSTSLRSLWDLGGFEDPPRAPAFSPFLQEPSTLQGATSHRGGGENWLHLSGGHLMASSSVLLYN